MILNFIKQKHIYKKLKSRNNQDKMLNVLSAAEEDFSSSSYFVFCYFCLIQFLLSWKTNPSFQLALAATLFFVLHDFPPTHPPQKGPNKQWLELFRKFFLKKGCSASGKTTAWTAEVGLYPHRSCSSTSHSLWGVLLLLFFVNNEATQKPEKL